MMNSPFISTTVSTMASHRHASFSPVEEDSDSGEDGDTKPADVEALQASIFGDYASLGKMKDAMNDTGVAKVRGLLVAAQSGCTVCLICLERVKRSDFVWDCKAECYAIFHLTCIQSWARQSLDAAAQRRAVSGVPSEENLSEAAAHWYCPKCRAAYSRSEIPKVYTCFCGREANPVPDPWLAPHTCGERCGRALGSDCGHECKLLCHPGPCPPCPQLLDARCFCEEKSEVRRCGRRSFSCGGVCGRVLPCDRHTCENACHEGECPSCTKTGVYHCRCKNEVALRACTDSDFQCARPCGRELSCKKHVCEKGCHSGSCGDCLLTGRRTCPCGKLEYKGVSCDKAVSTCGSTCEKSLGCGLHKCQERCHFGPCNTTCRVTVFKACHCGSLKKQVPCHQDLLCERKCQRLRDCARHACRKRCCDGNCPPCSEICEKKLRCGNHKCPAPCHRGVCSPCPVSVRISCACGATWFEVPCGLERNQKPPACSSRCQIIPRCSHGANCEPHACHYGDCPPCQLICNYMLACGHKCPERCHGPRPMPNPEYTLKPKKKKRVNNIHLDEGAPCPPCLVPVVKRCLGQHDGEEKTMLCSAAQDFQCENPCGRLLSCGNHFCTRPCHSVHEINMVTNLTNQLHEFEATSSNSEESSETGQSIYDTCEPCLLQCQKERASCSHPCPLPCHSGDCPPCKFIVKKGCHCDTLVHALDCFAFTSASKSELSKMLSCGGPCHKKLPNCAHMCSDICHPGDCRMVTSCRKKVVVRCGCGRLKKEWPCSDVIRAQLSGKFNCSRKDGLRGSLFAGFLDCDKECKRLAAAQHVQAEAEQLRLRKLQEPEPAAATANTTVRRRRARHLADSPHQTTRWQVIRSWIKRWALIICVVVFALVVIYFGLVGLRELNTWMNRRDAARMRKRPHRNPPFTFQQPL